MTSSGWTRQHRCEYRQTTVQEPWGATCRLSPFALDGDDRLHGAFSSADQLSFKYAVDHGAEEPMTHIGWRAGEATLVVETLHTYPVEGRGVRSESTFRVL